METQTEQSDLKDSKKGHTVDPSIQCLFSRKPCKRKRLQGFDFCHKHILEDKNSPFQQCSFIIKSTEERCTNPAPKAINKKTFCLIHTRDPKLKKAHDEIMRRNLKRKLANRKAVLEQKKTASASSSSTHRSPTESKRPREEEPEAKSFIESDGMYKLQDNGGSRSEAAWFDENDSDAESVDSEEEDPLRHAGVWTLEESLKICRDKMIRKRSLYLEQYKRLHLLLKERRRKHLMRTAGIYQNHSSERRDDQVDDNLSNAEYRALGLYQHMNGTEALLEKQAKEKRARGQGVKTTQQTKCHQLTGTERCPNKVLPFTKYCLKHICNDPDQRLYRPCSFQPDCVDIMCDAPVAQIFRGTTCELHASTLPRYNSEAVDKIRSQKGSKDPVEDHEKPEDSSINEEESQEKNDDRMKTVRDIEPTPLVKDEEESTDDFTRTGKTKDDNEMSTKTSEESGTAGSEEDSSKVADCKVEDDKSGETNFDGEDKGKDDENLMSKEEKSDNEELCKLNEEDVENVADKNDFEAKNLKRDEDDISRNDGSEDANDRKS